MKNVCRGKKAVENADEKELIYGISCKFREMKTCDTNTIEHFKVPSMVLMERAALSVIEVIQKKKFHVTACW